MSFEFKRVPALLDTNILIAMSKKTKRSESFKPLFDFMKENEMEPFVLDVTKFEFVGYSSNKKDYKFANDWISALWSHPLNREDIELATKISAMYKCINPNISAKQISFIDCVHAAKMRSFGSRAVLITADVNDYPASLFDMPQVLPIEEVDGTTSFVAFKTNNESKWKTTCDRFEKSGS